MERCVLREGQAIIRFQVSRFSRTQEEAVEEQLLEKRQLREALQAKWGLLQLGAAANDTGGFRSCG